MCTELNEKSKVENKINSAAKTISRTKKNLRIAMKENENKILTTAEEPFYVEVDLTVNFTFSTILMKARG